jgi:hypothetical protein
LFTAVNQTSPVAEATAEVAVVLAQLGKSRGGGAGDQAAEEDAGNLCNFDTRPLVENGNADDGGGNEIDFGSEGGERKEGGIGPVPMTAPGHTRRKRKKASPVEKKKTAQHMTNKGT